MLKHIRYNVPHTMENENALMCVRKYELSFDDEPTELELPIRRRVIHVALQDTKPHLWVIVDLNYRTEKVEVYCIGTGVMSMEQDFPWDEHIGTVQTVNGNVWHYFLSARE